jgi:threonine synthase
MKNEISGYSFSDEETREAMRGVYKKSNYTLDPHGAIGYLGMKKYQSQNPESVGLFLETAHPAKFLDVVESTLQKKIPIPDGLKIFLSGNKITIACESDFVSFKNLLQKI